MINTKSLIIIVDRLVRSMIENRMNGLMIELVSSVDDERAVTLINRIIMI